MEVAGKSTLGIACRLLAFESSGLFITCFALSVRHARSDRALKCTKSPLRIWNQSLVDADFTERVTRSFLGQQRNIAAELDPSRRLRPGSEAMAGENVLEENRSMRSSEPK